MRCQGHGEWSTIGERRLSSEAALDAEGLAPLGHSEPGAQGDEDHPDRTLYPRARAAECWRCGDAPCQPRDQHVEYGRIQVEEQAKQHERQHFRGGVCADELREEGEKEDRHFRLSALVRSLVEDRGETRAPPGCRCRDRLMRLERSPSMRSPRYTRYAPRSIEEREQRR